MIGILLKSLVGFTVASEQFFSEVPRDAIVCIVDVKRASTNAVGVLWEGDVVKNIRGGYFDRIEYFSQYPVVVGKRHLVIAYNCDLDGDTLSCRTELQRKAYELNANGDVLIRDLQNSLMLEAEPEYEEVRICFDGDCQPGFTDIYFKMSDVLDALGIP